MARMATVERWRERVAAYEASGLTQREWSRRNGVSLSALAMWIKRLRSASALVPIVVEVGGGTVAAAELATVHRSVSGVQQTAAGGEIEATIGALRIRAGSTVDPTWLATVLKGLV